MRLRHYLLQDHRQTQWRRTPSRLYLEKIVVTPRRREETLQDLPLSIAVVSAQDLVTQGIYSTNQVGELVPNLSLKESTPGTSVIFIRGIGGGGSDPSFSFSSGLYVDGHYIPYSRGGCRGTLDIARIEVLRGPPGTLFGKNTTGGAVNIISTKLGPEFDSSLTARKGDYGLQDLRGMVNFPISDTVSARLSAASESSDGYYYNSTLDRDAGYRDLTAWRAALRFTPGKWTIDAVLSSEAIDNESRQAQCAPNPAGPSGLAFSWGDPGQVKTYACCAEAQAFVPYTKATDMTSYTNFEKKNAAFTAEWNTDGPVGGLENLAVTTCLSTREMQIPWLNEGDYTPFPITYFTVDAGNGIGTLNDTKAFEVLFEGNVNERLNFLAGVWFFDNFTDDAQGYDCKNFFDDNFDPVTNPSVVCPELYERLGPFIGLNPSAKIPIGPHPGIIQSAVKEGSRAIFGHITYAINDLWDVELGIRYTEDGRFGNTGPALEVLANAATADICGFEIELAALPWHGGSLRVDLGYLNNEYGNIETFDSAVGIIDLSTMSIKDLCPDWTLNASLEHTVRLGNGGTLTPMPGIYWQSDYDWQPPALPGADPHMGFCQQDSYAKLRARLTYEPTGSNYAVPLFGRNITDDLILSNCNYDFELPYSTYEAPAMWGLEFNGRWGNN